MTEYGARRYVPKWLSLCLMLSLFLATSACVSPRMYRPVNIQLEAGYALAFIEFDDQGEL